MAGKTKQQYEDTQEAAMRIVAAFGRRNLDAIEANAERVAILRQMARTLAEQSGCHARTARLHIAKAIRRQRHPDYADEFGGWGGKRAGAGAPAGNQNAKKVA